jgi:hypothetical protein
MLSKISSNQTSFITLNITISLYFNFAYPMTTNNIHGGMRIFVTRFLPHKKNKEKREEKIKKIQNIRGYT